MFNLPTSSNGVNMDPLSIIGATGFAIQALDFILKALSKSEQAGHSLAERRERLRQWRRHLSFCRMNLDNWFQLWGGYEDQDYCDFWGQNVHQDIQGWLADIKTLLDDIQNIIVGPSPPPAAATGISLLDWSTWRDLSAEVQEEIEES